MPLTNPLYTVDTTFTAKNIASAASVYDFTASASAKIQFLVKLNNAAGNGDYIAYLTHQWLGVSGTAVMLPKTTAAAASGETVIEFLSLDMNVKNTDKVSVMIDGLAGDTSVNGAIRIVSDNPSVFDYTTDTVLLPASAYTTMASGTWNYSPRTLTSFGTLVADIWNNPTRLLSAFGFTVATNSDANVTTIVTDYARRTGDYSTLTAGQVDTQLSSIHGAGSWLSGGGGSTAADVWTYGDRTLTQTAPQVIQSLVDNTQINVYKSTTFSVLLTNLPDFTGWQKMWLTVKENSNLEVPDTESIIQLQLTAPTGTASDGLLYINRDPATLTDGYLTVLSTTSLQMKVSANVTGNLPPKTLYYGIKYVNSVGDVVALADGGEFVIHHSTSKKVS